MGKRDFAGKEVLAATEYGAETRGVVWGTEGASSDEVGLGRGERIKFR